MRYLGSIRKRILQPTTLPKRRHGVRVSKTSLDSLKTTAMRLAEVEFGKPVEELLLLGSSRVVAKRLGLDHSTVSKWKTRLRLNYSVDNLPECSGCQSYSQLWCGEEHLCPILVRTRAGSKAILAKLDQLEAASSPVSQLALPCLLIEGCQAASNVSSIEGCVNATKDQNTEGVPGLESTAAS